MKIAYLLGSLNRGGTETLLLDVFRNAKSNDIDCIGVYRKTGILESDFLQSGIAIYKLPFQKNVIGYLIQLRRLLKSRQVEIVHAQQALDAFFVKMACLGTGIKILLTLHGYDYHESKFSKGLLKFIIRRTTSNLFVSDTQKKYYQEKYNLNLEKQKVVYNGISFNKFENLNTRGATPSRAPSKEPCKYLGQAMTTIREALQLSPDSLLLGTVGNFVSGRDQFTLCLFLKRLNEQKIDFHFLFIGKRNDKMPHLYDDCVNYCNQNDLSDKVSFLGSRNDVPNLLNQLDAFLYATDHDTFGIGVVEAMAAGIPVFVNDWGVMNEITDNGKQATLYKTKNEVDLLRHFLLFLQDKSQYQIIAKEAAHFVRERYSIEKHIAGLKEIYGRVGSL